MGHMIYMAHRSQPSSVLGLIDIIKMQLTENSFQMKHRADQHHSHIIGSYIYVSRICHMSHMCPNEAQGRPTPQPQNRQLYIFVQSTLVLIITNIFDIRYYRKLLPNANVCVCVCVCVMCVCVCVCVYTYIWEPAYIYIYMCTCMYIYTYTYI